MKTIWKIVKWIITFPFKVLYVLGYAWGRSSSECKSNLKSSFWWILIFFYPWWWVFDNCEGRTVVKKRNALITINMKRARTMSEDDVERNYQYAVDKGYFDESPELKKLKRY